MTDQNIKGTVEGIYWKNKDGKEYISKKTNSAFARIKLKTSNPEPVYLTVFNTALIHGLENGMTLEGVIRPSEKGDFPPTLESVVNSVKEEVKQEDPKPVAQTELKAEAPMGVHADMLSIRASLKDLNAKVDRIMQANGWTD